ncbi:Protein FAR1-RELATED SEQUENCE 5 [Linum perenne]
MAQVNKNAGIPLRSSWDVLCGHLGGEANVGCTKVDLKNFLGKIRQRQMMYDEETAINEYFRGKKEYGPGFYYNVEVDAREDMTNIFWADQQMQDDYAAFGDSITFDTTYRTNRNCRPLALFVGFNHHHQGVVFGACLMFDEMIESFQWLFRTFLHYMQRAPDTIFTD